MKRFIVALSLGSNGAPVTTPDNTGITLTKGERINLSKAQPGLEKALVGVNWTGKTDVDISAILIGETEKFVAPASQHIVFHANLSAENGAVVHSGDARKGDDVSDDSDNETISIDLSKLPANVHGVVIVASTHSENPDGSHGTPIRFGMVTKPVARLYDAAGKELYKFECDEDASTATCVELWRIYRKDGEWRIAAKGEKLGEQGIGLQAAVTKFS